MVKKNVLKAVVARLQEPRDRTPNTGEAINITVMML